MNQETTSQLATEIFEKTNLKVTHDDPAILIYLVLQNMMQRQAEQHKQELDLFFTQFKENTQQQLDNSNEYFVNNSEEYLQNLDEKFKQIINSFDVRIKDLSFILTKIQSDYDRQLDDKLKTLLSDIQTANQEILKRQRKIDTAKQRDVFIAGAGFLAGLIICILIVFIVR